ncbi:MAG: hypothetical protein AAFN78_03810 [Pseudomonadota bacterium]
MNEKQHNTGMGIGNGTDEQMVRKIAAMFEQSVEATEPQHAEALKRARQRAVSEAGAAVGRRWLPLAAAAGVTALAVSVALLMPSADRPSNGLVADAENGDIDILLGEESLEMIAELEFYDWLSAEADAG